MYKISFCFIVFQQNIHFKVLYDCLQCASVHVFAILVLRGYLENVFKLLKKIYTVSNEFSVYGSMLYIFLKNCLYVFYGQAFFSFYVILFLLY